MQYIIYPHNGSADHGTEARLRSLLKQLSSLPITLYSESPEEDLRYWPHPFFTFHRAPMHAPLFPVQDTMVLSFQGDHPLLFPRRIQHPLQVLLGACLPTSLPISECVPLFSRYSLLLSYDVQSYHVLRRIHPNVVYCPDPLFMSSPLPFLLPAPLASHPFVLLSLDPSQATSGSTLLFDNAIQLIRYLLDTTSLYIALVPFVCQPHHQDQELLDSLYQIFRHSGRILLLPEMTSRRIHYLCDKARFVISAYPAQTILAYQSNTPTFLLHDSVRAFSIAHELFGETRCHILSPRSLTDDQGLVRAVRSLISDERRIRRRLQEQIPYYQEQTSFFRQSLRALQAPKKYG